MTRWNAAQHRRRDDWGLADLETEPAFFRTTDPMWFDPPKPVTPRPRPRETPEELGRRLGRENAERARRYRREVPLERARLAFVDPDGEREAVVPISPDRARYTLRQAAIAARRPIVITTNRNERESGRDLLTRLGADPSRTNGVMRCPAHEDRSPSLSWRLAADGKALVRCHRGCTFREILAAAS